VAKTYEDLVSEARELLQDTDSTSYRWSNATILNHLNRGLQQLGRIRPDAFYDRYDANSLSIPEIVDDDAAVEPLYDWATTFQIDMMFYTPLVSYVVGSVEVTDDEFTVDGRAMMLLTAFRNSVLGI
jgi:hypothetical protein